MIVLLISHHLYSPERAKILLAAACRQAGTRSEIPLTILEGHSILPSRYIDLLVAGGLATICGNASAQKPPALQTTFAIVGARIEIGGGKFLAKGTVLVRDGIIEAVGTNVVVPAEAEIIKGDGLTVYPGFIDAHATKGITPPDAQPNQDTPPDASIDAPPFMREANRKGIRPELNAADYFTLTDDTLKPERQAGFTTELLMPSGGTINGVGALIDLNGLPRRDAVLRRDAAMGFSFGTAGGGYPNSIMGIIALTRQTLLDAQYSQTLRTAFDKGVSRRPPDDAGLTALQAALTGKMPVVYEADTEREIHRALKVADEFGVTLMLSGGLEAYKAAPLLAKRRIPVLISLNFGVEPNTLLKNKPVVPPVSPAIKPGVKPGDAPKPGADIAKPMPSDLPPEDKQPVVEDDKPVLPPNPNPGKVDPSKSVPPKSPDQTAEDKAKADSADEESDPPLAVSQERQRKWEEKVANASVLSRAGVPIAFTTRGLKSPSEFLTNLRRAIKAGLPKEAALRALTLGAAQIFGVERQIGTVAVGKTAALVVLSGDFANDKTQVRYLFIDRQKFDLSKEAPAPAAPRRRFCPADDDRE